MLTTFLDFPPDILQLIIDYLSIDDFVSLSSVNKLLRDELHQESSARRCIQHNLPFATEGQSALAHGQHYLSTLFRISGQRRSLRAGYPHAVSHVASSDSWVYNEGTLVYVGLENELRILDLASKSFEERILGVRFIVSKIPAKALSGVHDWTFEILAVKDSILCLSATHSDGSCYLLALDISDEDAGERCVFCEPLLSTKHLTVLLDRQHLCYCTLSARNSIGIGHLEWLLRRYRLSTSTTRRNVVEAKQLVDHHDAQEQIGSFNGSTEPYKSPIQLRGLSGDDSATIAFTLHNGSFIALTNTPDPTPVCVRRRDQESHWISHYRYIMFPLDEPKPHMHPKNLFRRRHDEGVLHDAWTQLSFTTDEVTGRLLLTEARREWVTDVETKSEGWVRSWYTMPFLEAIEEQSRASSRQLLSGDARHRHSTDVTKRFEASGQESHQLHWRTDEFVHAEDSSGSRSSFMPADSDASTPSTLENKSTASPPVTARPPRAAYIRPKTLFSTYDSNQQLAVEIVIDDVLDYRFPTNIDPHAPSHYIAAQKARLRCVSRTETTPTQLGRIRYTDSKIRLWPNAATNEAHEVALPQDLINEVLSPPCGSKRFRSAQAALGPGILLVSFTGSDDFPCSSRSADAALRRGCDCKPKLWCISFEPSWSYAGMKDLRFGLSFVPGGSNEVPPPLGPYAYAGASSPEKRAKRKRDKEDPERTDKTATTISNAMLTHMDNSPEHASTSVSLPAAPSPTLTIWKEKAMYLRLRKGWRLR